MKAALRAYGGERETQRGPLLVPLFALLLNRVFHRITYPERTLRPRAITVAVRLR